MIGNLIWAAVAAFALALGLAASFIRAPRIKLFALALACIMPAILVLGVGVSQGCLGAPGGDECFGYSFGLTAVFGLLPGWIVLVILGTWTKHYLGGGRERGELA